MSSRDDVYLTTGEAASLCSVTPDTVLKWIRAGKIKAHRTPGGHNRIPKKALDLFFDEGKEQKTTSSITDSRLENFQYCWEFNSKTGVIPDGCKECIVYRSRTIRCYEMSNLPTEFGHHRTFCDKSCDECEYFRQVNGKRPNILIVTDQDKTKNQIEAQGHGINFDIQITDCEYRCSMTIEDFRPDYIIIDCAFGRQRSFQFAKLLYEDPRISFTRVILAGSAEEIPKECDKLVFGYIKRPFTTEMLEKMINGFKT